MHFFPNQMRSDVMVLYYQSSYLCEDSDAFVTLPMITGWEMSMTHLFLLKYFNLNTITFGTFNVYTMDYITIIRILYDKNMGLKHGVW